MADCFIIMPITTPEFLVSAYGGDKNHFQHVLDCLFIPAVKKAGLNPIPPIAKGADVIQAGIVQNLEKNDLVLCDMSSLNANVFFELGIRTAIGKPVCVVKDDATPKVPFDMTVVNYHTYCSALSSWLLETEINSLAVHLKESVERSAGENLLWKYFSLSQRAQLPHPKPQDEALDRLAMLSVQVEGLSRKIDAASPKVNEQTLEKMLFGNKTVSLDDVALELVTILGDILNTYDIKMIDFNWNSILKTLTIKIPSQRNLPENGIAIMEKRSSERGITLIIKKLSSLPSRPSPFSPKV